MTNILGWEWTPDFMAGFDGCVDASKTINLWTEMKCQENVVLFKLTMSESVLDK